MRPDIGVEVEPNKKSLRRECRTGGGHVFGIYRIKKSWNFARSDFVCFVMPPINFFASSHPGSWPDPLLPNKW